MDKRDTPSKGPSWLACTTTSSRSAPAKMLRNGVLEEPNNVIQNLGQRVQQLQKGPQKVIFEQPFQMTQKRSSHPKAFLGAKHQRLRRSRQTPPPAPASCTRAPRRNCKKTFPIALLSEQSRVSARLHPGGKTHKDFPIEEEAQPESHLRTSPRGARNRKKSSAPGAPLRMMVPAKMLPRGENNKGPRCGFG